MTKTWKWTKRFLYTLLTLLLLLLLTVAIVVYLINSESFIEKQIEKNFGMSSDIGELDVSLFKGSIDIGPSRIGDKDNPAITFERLTAKLSYSDLLSSKLSIEKVKLDKANIRYPFDYTLVETETSEPDEPLFLDFIEVSDIEINDLNFDYQETITLKGTHIDLRVKDLPVADQGRLVFDNLTNLFKISRTDIALSVEALEFAKSSLHNVKLSAHVKDDNVIIELLEAGSAEFNIDILDQQQAQQSTKPSTKQQSLTIPFHDLILETFSINKTRINIKGQQSLEVDDLNVNFKNLLLVNNKNPLWLDWPQFYASQNSVFEVTSSAINAEQVSLDSFKLNGVLKEGLFTIQQFNVQKPHLTLPASASQSTEQTHVKEPIGQETIHLPFHGLLIENARVDNAAIEFGVEQGSHKLSIANAQLFNIPLIHQSKLISESLSAGPYRAQLDLKTVAYEGAFGRVESIDTRIKLHQKEATVSELVVNKADITYHIKETGNRQTDKSETEQASNLPLDALLIDKLSINDSVVSVAMGKQQKKDEYRVAGLTLQANNLPIIQSNQLVVSELSHWQDTFTASATSEKITIPQGEVASLAFKLQVSDEVLTVDTLALTSATLVFEDGMSSEGSSQQNDSQQNSQQKNALQKNKSQAEKPIQLPFKNIVLVNSKINNINVSYLEPEQKFVMTNADFNVSNLRPVSNYQLITDIEQLVASAHINFMVDISALELHRTSDGEEQAMTLNHVLSQGRLKNNTLDVQKFEIAKGRFDITAQAQEITKSKTDSETTEQQQAVDPVKLPIREVNIASLNVRDVDLMYQVIASDDDKVSTPLHIDNLNLAATSFTLVKDFSPISEWYSHSLSNAFKLLSLQVDSIEQQHNNFTHLKAIALQENDVIRFMPLEVMVNKTPISLEWTLDLTEPHYYSTLSSQFDPLKLEDLVVPANEESIALVGNLKGHIDIEFSGLTYQHIASSLNGSIQLNNEGSLQMQNLNVNKVLRHFLDSQSFGLLDIGGFLLAGPAGLLLSQGVSFQGVISNMGADEGDTQIEQLNLDMKIENGMVNTHDVAVSTDKYRFAFNGAIDLNKQEFRDFDFDIINDKGCSEFGQTLSGQLQSPDIETLSAAFDAVTGSVVGLFKGGINLLTGGSCTSIYEGVVSHPSGAVEIIKPRPAEPEIPKPSATQ